MAKEIFISYKSEEYSDAFWVKEQLEKEGLSCWMAPMDISGGTSYATEIPKAIKNCKVFVLILSKGAQESKWVPRELDQAINENKIIMPFTIKKCTLQSDFSFYLTNVQRYDAYLNKNSAMESLTRDIKKHLGIKEKPVEKSSAFADLGLEEFFGQQAKGNKEEQEKAEKQKALEQRMQKAIDAGMKKHRQKQKLKEFFRDSKKRNGIIAGVVAVIVFAIIGHITNQVQIAGKSYDKTNTYHIQIENQTLSAEDIKGISELKELSNLNISGCTFTESNIGDIIGEELYSLTLKNCNLTPAQIESLDFSNSDLWDCDLSGNTNLTSLDMFEPVKDRINSIDISGTSVTDLSPLASCTKLVEFYADGCGISDISALSTCIELNVLSLNDNELTSLAGLENATVLQHVFLNNNQLADVSILEKSAGNLKSLFIRNNQVSDISFLETCVALQYVGLDNNKITTLSSLENASELIGLSASGNQLTATTGIEGLKKIQCLNLADNDITVVGGTETIVFADTAGAVLDLSNNPLESVNVSYGGTFKFLSLANCNTTDYSFMENIDGYELVITYSDAVDIEVIDSKSYYDVKLIGCPLDKQVGVKDILGESTVTFVEEGAEIYNINDYYNDTMKGTFLY